MVAAERYGHAALNGPRFTELRWISIGGVPVSIAQFLVMTRAWTVTVGRRPREELQAIVLR
jgi:hypothetical protein